MMNQLIEMVININVIFYRSKRNNEERETYCIFQI
ncbi:MAG: hypothetical protein PWP38_510 [Clostridiales bacterium]|nr:hypothetical protein [Clostridiales bacterium]